MAVHIMKREFSEGNGDIIRGKAIKVEQGDVLADRSADEKKRRQEKDMYEAAEKCATHIGELGQRGSFRHPKGKMFLMPRAPWKVEEDAREEQSPS